MTSSTPRIIVIIALAALALAVPPASARPVVRKIPERHAPWRIVTDRRRHVAVPILHRGRRADRDAPRRPDLRAAALTQLGEELRDIAGEQLRLLGGREVAAARHHRPAPDVVEPLGPLARRRALGDVFVREHGYGGRDADEVVRTDRRAVPAFVVVVAHRAVIVWLTQ